MELSAAVKFKIERVWEAQGADWIERFPQTLCRASERWSLTEIRPFPNLSYHFVASARMGPREVVLKLGVPELEFFEEADALKAFGSAVCVELIDQDPALAALLLERVLPGAALESLWTEETDDQCTEAMAKTMCELWGTPAMEGSSSVRDWAKALEPDYVGIPGNLLQRARQLLIELESTASGLHLLHGDLHHGNVLQSGAGFKVIDPKGVLGDPAFEVYAQLRNPVGASAKFTLENWERRVDIVAAMTGLNKSRLLIGAFCGTMISCCWSAEEGGRPPEADLELARRLEAGIC